ncbi:MAG: 7-cyano-7-deazaguanine/7-aminomethyl-7-deazaguanine transporter [Tatlockia sp.]|nr:7-cyano-7-deazaguanine/7-aminomethyl-7-deazaguanine transporter [Tatlockia sp.]
MIFKYKKIQFLVLCHIAIFCLSNILVLYPFVLFGLRTTWGAFTYPLIFVLTDLTTRIIGPENARKIIFKAMFPAVISSFLISNFINQTELFTINVTVLRISLASFIAYILGQMLDITIFQKFKQNSRWWVAPSISTIFGNFFDTYCFFFIAFYQSSNLFLSAHWLEIATVDLAFKLAISLITFIPLYGFILQILTKNRRTALA